MALSRQYLNRNFLNSFSETDRARIRETYVVNNDNPWWGGSLGVNNTQDRVFLLSIDEVVQYFSGSNLLEIGRNESNRDGSIEGLNNRGIWGNNDVSNTRVALDATGRASWWWLRSPGLSSDYAATVSTSGSLVVGGYNVDWTGGGVRPALWLNLE